MDKKEEEILQNTEGYQQYEESFIVGQYECDCNGRIKAGALMSQCQAISTNHCNSIGMTIDVYHKTHTVFLLAKASLEIYGEIHVGDKIRMVTRPSSPNRAVYSRYTRFFNEQGEEVAAQDSKWVLVDTDTRKILRNPPEEMHFPFNLPIEKEHDFTIPKVRDAQKVNTERVTYSRTDDNGHLNNTQYADILLDNLPFSATVEKTLRKMVINYHSEAKMGEELSIFVKELDEETIKAPMIGYYVSGENESGKKCFEGLAVFES